MSSCPICLENINLKIETPCQHTFHPTCLLKWRKVHITCPLCRADITSILAGPIHENKDSKNLLETLAFHEKNYF